MKRKFYFCMTLCLLAMLLCLWNCTDTEWIENKIQRQHEGFSMEEARDFFEKEIMRLSVCSRTLGTGNKTKRFSPGDFVPDWNKAVASEKGDILSYNIPISTEYALCALHADYRNEKARAERVSVYQKLLVVKSRKSGKLEQFILTLIPDVGKEDKSACEAFVNGGGTSDFTGVVVYTLPVMDRIIRVNHYTNGVKDKGIALYGNRKDSWGKINYARLILKNITIKRYHITSTRSGEYYWDDTVIDDWLDDGGDIFDFGDDWIFIDENGDAFIAEDTDGDGNPDALIDVPEDIGGSQDDWFDPDYSDPDYGEAGCPYCGSIGCSGECLLDIPDMPEEDLPDEIEEIKNTLEDLFGEKINDVVKVLTIEEGSVPDDKKAVQKMSGTLNDMLYDDTPIKLIFDGSLNDTQLKIVMMHEYLHLEYLEISRDAGNRNEFYLDNPELYNDIVHSDADTDWGKIDDGHHQYMGGHIEEIEELYREAFPNEDEEFYEYGKWGGGAINSQEFENLSDIEKEEIMNYLMEQDL